jgi:cell division protein FtsW
MARHCSTILCIAVAALVALGLVMLASTSAWVKGVEDPYHFLSRQAVMVALGLFAAIMAVKLPMEKFRALAPWMFCVACVLLALCYVPGIGVSIFGSKRWIQVPLVGQFQPSELSKIVVVICLAAWFARWQTEVHTFWRGFVLPGMIAGVPIALIAGETDVGTALSLSVAVGAILFCVGTRLRYAVPTALMVISAAAWYIYNDANRWGRIEAWLDLENPVHQLDRGMQQWRALLALGNGGPWGVGLGNGVEKFGTLTFAHIDFIFPVVGEELGLPFTLGVVFCYVLIAVAGCGIALQSTCVFNRCVALGLTCVIVVPAMVNIGVTTALLPNDGLPLPFVSYGGTSLIFSLAAVGMLVGIHRRSQVRVPQEFPLNRQTRLAVRL